MNYKQVFLIVVLSCFQLNTSACDMCACGAGSNYSGIIPNFSKNLVGLRYQHQKSTYILNDINANGTSIVEGDNYHRTDLYFRYYATKRVQLMAFLPYQVHQRIESLRTTTITGVGDINAIAYYTFFNTGDSIGKTHKHTWYAGGGVKLPTGKYQQRDETKAMLPSLFQIGTGAYAFSVQNIYTYRFKNVGINTNLQYRYNLKNEIGFKLGNQIIANANLFYFKKFRTFSLLPSVGFLFDQIEKNENFNLKNPTTGGYASMASIGVDTYYKRFVFQLMAFSIVDQNLSVAMPQNRWKFTFGVAFFLEKKDKKSVKE